MSQDMPSDSDYAGRWFGLCQNNEPESFLELVITRDEEGKWTLCMKDRHYERAPESTMIFSSGNEFEAFVPHWILLDPCKVKLLGRFREGKLSLQVLGSDMTGMNYMNSAVEFDRDLQKWKAFLQPLDIQLQAAKGMFDHLIASVLNEYSATANEPIDPRIDALAVGQDGVKVFERSFWGLANTDLHNISSCTKSITSILAGIAIDQGLFSLDNKVVKFFPWITNTRWGEEPPVLVRHVLSMTSGTVDTPSRSAEMLVSSDVEEFVLSAERDCHPGTRYQYNNSLPSLIGSIIERTGGMSLEQFANLYLFGPLGIKAYEWSKMKMSTSKVPLPYKSNPVLAAGGLRLSLDSMIRIGELLLNRGIYKSQRVVSEDYIDAATLPQTPKDDYQYGFYFHINELASSSQGRHLNLPDGYHALGQGEQFITVSPRKKLVIAGFGSSWQTSRAENPPRRGNTKTFKAFDLLNKTIIDEV